LGPLYYDFDGSVFGHPQIADRPAVLLARQDVRF